MLLKGSIELSELCSDVPLTLMKLNSENRMCRLAQNQTRQIHRIHPKTKGNFRETCKLQNINHISQTPRLHFGIIQIIIKSMTTILVLSLIKRYIFLYSI